MLISDYAKPLKKLLLGFLITFHSSAFAGYFEVEPEVGEWTATFCNVGVYLSDDVAFCRAAGGTWHGAYASPSCSGHDSTAFRLLPIEEQVSKFSKFRYNMCGEPTVTFTGWNATSTWCWGTGSWPKYKYGKENRSVAYLNVTGTGNPPSCQSNVDQPMSAVRNRDVTCPAGSTVRDEGNGQLCYRLCQDNEILINGHCGSPPVKEIGCSKNLTSNPCNIATGNKFRSETDFSYGSTSFTRYYNSLYLQSSGYGIGWRTNYHKDVISLSTDSMLLISSNGNGELWQKSGGIWQGNPDSKLTLVEIASGFRIVRPNSAYEDYDSDGRIVSKTDANGHEEAFTYNAQNQLIQVMNHYGQSLAFAYNSGGRLETVTDPQGDLYRYEYNDIGNLVKVSYPDQTLNDDSDNPSKIYHYDNIGFPNHLTGITDENGDRYATFDYDDNGKAILSELGATTNSVGQERIELNYQGSN